MQQLAGLAWQDERLDQPCAGGCSMTPRGACDCSASCAHSTGDGAASPACARRHSAEARRT
jgi:hypothetical protein